METDRLPLPDVAIPPGEFIAEILEDMDLTQAELARRMRRPAQAISEIIRGRKSITPRTAIELENALDVPAYFWLRLESQYRLVLERQALSRTAS
jgi:HTH-type transcriptional regulator/antitoxin HigA